MTTLAGYEIIRPLGEGVYGRVELALDGDQLVAIKRMKKVQVFETELAFEREVKAGLRLNHPSIVEIKASFETEDEFCLVMEYIDGVDLVKFMEEEGCEVPEYRVKQIFREVLEIIDYCHKAGIAHRDIKLENLLIDRQTNRVKLIDFGLACLEEPELCIGKVGSPEYCCPEILEQDYGEYNGFLADAWSAGVTLYAMLNGRFPFGRQQLDDLSDGRDVPLIWANSKVSVLAKQLVGELLEPDPSIRLSISQARNHPWFRTRLRSNSLTLP